MAEELIERVDRFEFKSPLRLWTDLLTIATIIFLALVVLTISKFHIEPWHAYAVSLLGFGAFSGIRKLCMSETTIEINSTHLNIYQYNKFLNKEMVLNIPLEKVRGIEISQITTGRMAMVIHDKELKYYKYSIISTPEELELRKFVNGHFPLLYKTNNPSFNSYWSAFFFGLRKMLLFIAIVGGVITSLHLWNLTAHRWSYYMTYAIALIVSLLAWWFLIFPSVRKNHFRFRGTYWLVNAFLFLSPLFTIFIVDNYITYTSESVTIQYPVDIIRNPIQKTYIIKHTSVDLNKILLYNSIYHNPKFRQPGRLVNSYATPLENGSNVNVNRTYMFWLVKKYTKKVNPINNQEKAAQIVSNFQSETKEKLKNDFLSPPTFYTPVVDFDADFAAIYSKIRSGSGNIILLNPHWETLDAYRNEYLLRCLFGLLFMLSMSLFWCAALANSR